MEEINKKYGLIIEELSPDDYIFGSFTPVKHNIINESRNWFPIYSILLLEGMAGI
jgi:hypothetical protein